MIPPWICCSTSIHPFDFGPHQSSLNFKLNLYNVTSMDFRPQECSFHGHMGRATSVILPYILGCISVPSMTLWQQQNFYCEINSHIGVTSLHGFCAATMSPLMYFMPQHNFIHFTYILIFILLFVVLTFLKLFTSTILGCT